ncbi:tail fiber protein [Escherichia coli]|uniref:beta strand repeat-containing protein n=1 Tax=Escherichia coli TaxID=562 RepID=UPI0019968F55|nr:tail fiber protein [Escherichia coli]HAL1064642.1 phage tail protein [Escherichia coli]
MGADKTKSIMTLSSGVSQPLLADVQYFELYSSLALNRKLKNIVMPGFYCGFEPVPGTGLSVRITSENSEGKGAASVDVNNVQISVQQIEDVTVSVKAGATNIIVLEANFEHGVKTTQVDSASSVSAARIYARTDNTIGQNQIELCRVIVPSGATAVTKEMIVLKYRVNRAVGVEFSNEISSTEERKAATPLAVKTLHDLVDTKAPLDSPHLSGTPTSPTPEPGTNNTQIANAAFVYAAINALINGAPGTMDTLKEIAAAINNDPKFSETINKALALKAPLASPAFTGTPTVPTASQGTNSTQIANTAFVKAAITALINGAPGTLDTLKEIAAAINNDPNFSTTINNALALKAPLASPALTGIPTAPTAAQGTNNTQIATTAYVRAAISALVGSSPEALDTLNELAAALGNDPNFATTMTNALAGKQPLDATLTALAGLTTGANKLPYFTGTDTVSQTDLTSVGRDILAKTSTLAVIQYLGLREIGTSGEKIPLLSTANTWSSQQTFKGKTAFSAAATFSAGIAGAIDPEDIGGQTVDLNNLTIRSDVGAIKYYYCPTSGGGANITNKPDGVTGNFLLRVESTRKVSASDYANMQTLISNDTKRIYVRFVVNGSRAAWSQVVVSGWGQDVSVKSLSAVALSGSLTGNASTATKLQTVRTIGGVSFDGSANIDLPGVNKTGNQSTTGNAATATKLQTARTIGGVSFDGSANINLPGVNIAGNQNTTGNAATATKLLTARTINGVSFDGSANISLSPANIGCPASPTGWLVTGDNGASITTEQLVTLLRDNGAFNAKAWIARCAWAYANSASIPDSETGCGIIPLAGAVIEVFNNGSSSNNYTIRITTATTTGVSGALTNAEFVYVFNGTSYSPGWRRAYNTKNKPTAADVGALPLSGGALTGGLTAAGEIISKSANGLRIAYGNYGFFIRNDGSNTYFMLTNSGNSLGTYNNLRPLIINNANGTVTIGNGLNVTGGINGSLNGNAATATKLQTVRTIGGVSFDGSANIDLPGVNKTGNQSTTGNAATATKLQTARTIGGVSFDGSANIDLPGVNKAGNQSTTGNAATATKLQTARTINGVKFDGSANITLTAANLGLSDSSGYVGRLVNTRVFTSSGTYTPTPGTKRIRVTITGGGGGGGGCQATSNNETFFGAGGGAGGTIISIMTPTQNSYPVTIGAGGGGGVGATNGLKGGDSSFGTVIAPGGEGGGKVGVTNTNGGNGGAPNTGDVRIIGGHGGDGQSGNISVSGEGGSSFWGGGGRAGAGGGVIGRAYGSGGGGAYDAGYSGTSMTGGKGAAGICIIEEFA